MSFTEKPGKNHCGYGHKSGQDPLKIGDDPRFGLSMPKNPSNKTTLGLLCCWIYIFYNLVVLILSCLPLFNR